MYRVFHCFGTEHPRGSLEYFFVILTVTQEEMKRRPLSGTEIMNLGNGRIQKLTSTAENDSFSSFVDKLLPMLEHQYGQSESIMLLESCMELVARSTNKETFDAAAFLRQNAGEQIVSKIYAAISLYNQGSTAELIGNLAKGAFALSRQEALPAWDDSKDLTIQASLPPAPEVQAAA